MKYNKMVLIIVLSIFLMGISFLLLNMYGHINNQRLGIYVGKNMDFTIEIKEKVKEYAIGNINGDNKDYLVILTGAKWEEYGKEVVIFSLEEEAKEIYRRDFSEFNPWKIAIGDIDGDKKEEISIGVYKKSPLHEIMAKRPFIYSFEEGKLEPKWRGSRLSRPFIDYNFYDIDGDGIEEIISIEILENNRKIINTYKWKGFGFEGYLETKDYEDITRLIIEEDKAYVEIKDEKGKYLGLIKLENNDLIIERED